MQTGFQPTSPSGYKTIDPLHHLKEQQDIFRAPAKDTVKFGNVKGARTAQLTFETPKPSDAADIEDLHTMLMMQINPNRMYGVPMNWTQKRVMELRTLGVRQVRDRIQKSYDHPDQNFWRIARNKHGEIVGFAEVFKDKSDEQKVLLYGLYIHPDYQGSAASKKLFEDAIQWARGHHYTSMELSVAPYNPAISFYRDFGFDIVPNSLEIFDKVMPLLSMSLDLTRSTPLEERGPEPEPLNEKPSGFFQKMGAALLGKITGTAAYGRF